MHHNLDLFHLFRIIWGLFGPKHARFSDFLYGPSIIFQYLSGLIKGNPTHYLGHNPAGGLMVFVMLITLLVTAFSGLKAIGSKGHGPFADKGYQIVRQAMADKDDDEAHSQNEGEHRSLSGKHEFWGEFHEAMTCPFPNQVANAEAEIITNIHQFSNENCQFRLVTYGDKI